MTPYDELGAVEVARLQERLKGVETELAEVKTALKEQGREVRGLSVDIGAFVAEVRGYMNGEEAATKLRDDENKKWRSDHEARHGRDTNRSYTVLGLIATAAVVVSTAVSYMVR